MTQSDFRRQQYIDACQAKAKYEAEMTYDAHHQQTAPAAAPAAPEAAEERGTLLTVDEVAKRLNVHRSTVKRMCDDGRLSRVKSMGRAIRIRPKSVRDFENGRREARD